MTETKNTYSKYCPNVYLAKCPEKHERGEEIILTTRYGKENESIVFNLIYEEDGVYYYSIVRADGFDSQAYAERKAEKYGNWADKRKEKSDQKMKDAEEGKDFLALGEPIKIGHHSERKHRNLIERNRKRMDKSVEHRKESKKHQRKADYWERQTGKVDLSMPESIGYFQHKLKEATEEHARLKAMDKSERPHARALAYANKRKNKMKKKLDTARKLWE